MKHVLRLVFVLFGAVTASAACGGGRPETSGQVAGDHSVSPADSAAVPVLPVEVSPDAISGATGKEQLKLGPLCLLLKKGEDAQLELAEILLGEEPRGDCVSSGPGLTFGVLRPTSREFFLFGTPGVRYCVEIIRRSGYITISHMRGDVERNADKFRWCVSPEQEYPEYMTVRSLTPKSSFELLL